MRVLPWLGLALLACQGDGSEPATRPPLSAPTPFRHEASDDWYLAPESLAATERMLQERPPGVPLARFRRTSALAKVQEGDAEAGARELDALVADIDGGRETGTPDLRRRLLRDRAIAWLRVGEQGNCILHHGAETCLLPISEAGRHVDPRGSRQAMSVLQELLAERPSDLEARWLLNVAAMTVGEWPDGVPDEWLVPPEAFESEGEAPRFRETAAARGLAKRQLAGGLCLDDFDGDGLLDVITSEYLEDSPLHFYRNQGGGRFEDGSLAAGVANVSGGMNLVHADVDNDGASDLLVLRTNWTPDRLEDWPVTLLVNDGRGGFRDATAESGLDGDYCSRTAAFADYDGDGLLDLFIGNESTSRVSRPSRLFRGTGAGRFADASADSGVELSAHVRGCAWGDADNDGDPDLLVSLRDSPPLLYRNDSGHFQECAAAAGITGPARAFGCAWTDFDNDGLLDIFVAGHQFGLTAAVCADWLGAPAASGTPRLYRNLGGGRFLDVTRPAGLARVLPSMGLNFGDVDNDGWKDLYLGTGEPDICAVYPNRLFLNADGRRFLDVTTAARVGHLQKGNALAFGDIDADGDQDIVQILGGVYAGDSFPRAVFENLGAPGRWIVLRLEGRQANRCAIGARVRVRVERRDGSMRDIHHLVGTGGSYGSQPLQVELGLGDAAAVDEIEIIWPGSGTRQLIYDAALDSRLVIVEPRAP